MEDLCPICEGAGMRIVERAKGVRVAIPCECKVSRFLDVRLERAQFPDRHKNSTLDNYVHDYDGPNDSLARALVVARTFVESYPGDLDGKGLLLVGDYGVGKSHLAAGILRALIERGTREFRGLFVDYQDLLKKIQDSYGRSDISERQLLAPVFEADVLMLDELGSAKPTEWVWDMVQHILNTRYNDCKTTIITTNFRNERETPMDFYDHLPKDKRDSYKAMHRDTLGDRVTERIRSRLMEMCVVIEMNGTDFRSSDVGKANLKRGKLSADELLARRERNKRKPDGRVNLPTSQPAATSDRRITGTVTGGAALGDGSNDLVGPDRLGRFAAHKRKMTEEELQQEKKRLQIEAEINAIRRATGADI